MRIDENGPRVLEFRGCRLEVDSGDLHGRDGRKTRLAPQPTTVLALLAVEPGRLVTREAIAERLWPHGSVEIDQGIGYAVREVRKALESVGCDPSSIETIPRRGFRLQAEEARRVASSSRNLLPWAALAPVLLAVGALGAVGWMSFRPPATPAPVVVVFEHGTSGDAPSETTAASLASSLTTRLTQDHPGILGVVGPTGAATLSGPNDTEGARDRLGACLVVSGSVRPGSDGSLVVFTQAVRTTDRVHLWASTDTVAGPTALDATLAEALAGIEGASESCSSG